MPWKECSVVDERLRFVAQLLDGEAMSEVCRAFAERQRRGCVDGDEASPLIRRDLPELEGALPLFGRIEPGPIPALFARKSMRPNPARAASVISSAAESVVRSVWMVSSSAAFPCL
jgi:hypothetical protein